MAISELDFHLLRLNGIIDRQVIIMNVLDEEASCYNCLKQALVSLLVLSVLTLDIFDAPGEAT